ncbi:VPLPA-CTERM sorting domain-containing protein [Pseudooceanicola onchidii]|uniref:VPLPA-CTERM sorting domain-containing protein n=1 Tax=Pseudooceanicola onchidii TaxID=2562279 RepID=UPI0010AA783D|nr:VPLPA-CTERM sorting domain-containing protein [Pseudooceanicola onchidii]
MGYLSLAASAAVFALSTTIASAAPVGQPFAVIEGSGFILDNFQFSIPSGVKSVTLNGTVTSTVGWDAADGLAFSFDTNPVSGTGTLTLGTHVFSTSATGDWLIDGTTGGGYPFDPFTGTGPGDLVFDVLILPDLTNYTDNGSTVTVEYEEPFAAFGPRTDTYPEFPLQLSVYLSAPLPLKTYEEVYNGTVVDAFDYVEGALSIDYMTLGYPGGAPLPEVPLPAGFPLLLAGLTGLRLIRRGT